MILCKKLLWEYNKYMQKLSLFFLLLLLMTPTATGAISLNLDYPTLPGGLDINDRQGLTDIIAWLYVFLVGISGLAAFIMIVWGGVQWMSSQGNPTATSDAKDRIKMALLGLLLVLASFLILQIINPELTLLRSP